MSTRLITVADYMTNNHIPFKCGCDLNHVIERLIKEGLTGLPVVDEHKELIGWVSEQDCMKAALNDSYFGSSGTRVNEVMRTDVLSVKSDLDIITLAQQMLGQKPKIYPVIDNKRLIGIITRSDVLKALNEHAQSEVAQAAH